ncbi:ComEC/Rec2 family competence protein [Candidatus Uhrbacteria bacterium]|nr:ComEC/Rec2 family competence protein [Candidatus Uhrbacteria bacterium]
MRLHEVLSSPSKTLAISLAVFCFGILLARAVPVSWWQAFFLLAVVLCALCLIVRRRELRFLFALAAIFFFALFRFTSAMTPSMVLSLADVPSAAARVEGVVAGQVERRANTTRVVLEQVVVGRDARAGKLLVWAPLYPEIPFGARLVFNCRIAPPEPIEGFAYDRYLESQGILAVCLRPEYIDVIPSESFSVVGALLMVRDAAVHRLEQSVPEPHASFLTGLLLGGSSSLSRELKDDFAATGTSHILAASGFNVSLFSLTFLSWILTTRIGRRRGLLLATFLIVSYVLMAGATPAVVRAGIMGGVVIVSKWISRKAYLVNVLLATASVMLLIDPLVLSDVGFQLSFAATAGIIALTDRVSERLSFIPDLFALRTSFAASLCAILVTLPIVLWQFGTVSLVAPFVNLLVLPLVPYAMWLTLLALGAVTVFGTLVQAVFIPAWALSSFMLFVISAFGALPFALVEPAYAQILAAFVAAVLVAFFLRHRYASR